MTEQEAIAVLGGFRKAFRALDPTRAQQAVNALLNPGPAMSSGFRRARDFSSALSTLRMVFDEMDRKGI